MSIYHTSSILQITHNAIVVVVDTTPPAIMMASLSRYAIRFPTFTGDARNSVTLRCAFILGIVVMGVFSPSILFKYECRVGKLFVLSWDRVRRVALVSAVSE